MKLRITILVAAFALLANVGFAQSKSAKVPTKPTIVNLTQTPGEFEQKNMTLAPGDYIFQIENKEVGKDVGFYLHEADSKAPLANSDKAGLIPNNEKRNTEVVTLKNGTYVYSCPLNPTADYTITVK